MSDTHSQPLERSGEEGKNAHTEIESLHCLIRMATGVGKCSEMCISTRTNAALNIPQKVAQALAEITDDDLVFTLEPSLLEQSVRGVQESSKEFLRRIDAAVEDIRRELTGWGNQVLWMTCNYWSPHTRQRTTYVNLGGGLGPFIGLHDESALISRAKKVWDLYFAATKLLQDEGATSINQFIYERARTRPIYEMRFTPDNYYRKVVPRGEAGAKSLRSDPHIPSDACYLHVPDELAISQKLSEEIRSLFETSLIDPHFKKRCIKLAAKLADEIQTRFGNGAGCFAEQIKYITAFLERHFHPTKPITPLQAGAIIETMSLYHKYFATFFFTTFPIIINSTTSILSLSTVRPLMPSEKEVIQATGEKLFSRLMLRDVTSNEQAYCSFVVSNLPKPFGVRRMRAADLEKLSNKTLVKLLPIMFVDMENFTSFFNKISPDRESLRRFMRGFYEFLCDTVGRCNGWINKFLGDGALVVFFDENLYFTDTNEPDQITNAAIAALILSSMFSQFLNEFAKIYEEKNPHHHPEIDRLRLRIGLHFGKVFITNWGPRERYDYTVISDNVNFCSRLASKGPHDYYENELMKKNGHIRPSMLSSVLATDAACAWIKEEDFSLGPKVNLRIVKGFKDTNISIQAIHGVLKGGTYSAIFDERQKEAKYWLENLVKRWHKELNQTV